MMVQGECIRCGILIHYGDPAGDMFPATLFLTVPGRGPGRGAFKGSVFKAELVCKNQQMCVERQQAALA